MTIYRKHLVNYVVPFGEHVARVGVGFERVGPPLSRRQALAVSISEYGRALALAPGTVSAKSQLRLPMRILVEPDHFSSGVREHDVGRAAGRMAHAVASARPRAGLALAISGNGAVIPRG